MSATSSDAQTALDLHNKVRHEAPGGIRPDLVWSKSLEALAVAYAQKLVRMNRGMVHDPNLQDLDMGENIMMGPYSVSVMPLTLTESAQGWIDEKRWYKGEPVSGTLKDNRGNWWGHYTQVICPQTTKVGMGYASGPMVQYVVARYKHPQYVGDTPWKPKVPRHLALKPHAQSHETTQQKAETPRSSKGKKRDKRKDEKKSFLGSLLGGIASGGSSSRRSSS
ncbi:CAP domain-containing protein [Cadophora sp. MPI-SDFR-AT-0126]|nr:CAP domain-containing protein [Leotiomycetes sp. MPI-SDFR-AT-0126]